MMNIHISPFFKSGQFVQFETWFVTLFESYRVSALSILHFITFWTKHELHRMSFIVTLQFDYVCNSYNRISYVLILPFSLVIGYKSGAFIAPGK